ncbi:MAG: ABC transporter permease [Planctomycetota bacterium]
MGLLDLLQLSGTALTGHRLRTLLSLLGVAIGVAAVVLLTSLGEGARRYVIGQFEELGADLLIVIPGKTETAGALPGIGKPPHDLTLLDAEAIARRVPQVRLVVPVVAGTETVSSRDRSRKVFVIGATSDFLQVRRLRVATGSFLPPLEAERAMPVVVLGDTVARELFGHPEQAVGEVVRVGDWRLRVLGVLAARGTHMGMDTGDLVVMPVGLGMKMFDRRSLFRVLCDVQPGASLERARDNVLSLLRERHDGEEDVTALTQDALVGSFSAILTALTAALAGIAAISLTVAGLGIMNVMLVSVSERTAEVGLLKALGATSGQVQAVFLTEAVLLSTAGGVVGLAFALATVTVVGWVYPGFSLWPPAWAIAAALLISMGAGVVFGVLPARRATRLDPVAALGRR